MPTLRALECVAAVLEHGSVTAPPPRCTCPSRRCRTSAQLERQIGTPLLQRLPRGVRATVAGQAVRADAVVAMESAGRVVATGRAVARGEAGVLRVACPETMTAGLLAPVRRRRANRTRVELTELTSADEVAARVVSGAANVGVAPRPSRDDAATEVLGSEPLVAVLPRCHHLAGGGAPVAAARTGR